MCSEKENSSEEDEAQPKVTTANIKCKNEAFIRWQGYALRQLSFVNNLLIGLSTGVLGLQLTIALSNGNLYDIWSKHLFLFSGIFMFVSLIFGVLTSWNRLMDFRTTAKITREKCEEKREALREKAEHLGDRTWCLLKIQLVTFSIGTLLLLVLVILRMAV